MLTFKNTSWLFGLLLLLAIAADISFGISAWIYLLLYLGYSAIFFHGCFAIDGGFFTRVICKAVTEEKIIALSFDDGPSPDYTLQILQILERHQAKAAFFCIGHRVESHPGILEQVHRQGHIIANHSHSHHLLLDFLTAKKILADMQRMDGEVEKVIGLKPRLFRPPFGVTNSAVDAAIIKGGYVPIGWNVRSLDTATRNAQKLLARIKKGIHPGAIFLFHDTCENTLEILPEFLREVEQQGYRVVRLDRMLKLKAYQEETSRKKPTGL